MTKAHSKEFSATLLTVCKYRPHSAWKFKKYTHRKGLFSKALWVRTDSGLCLLMEDFLLTSSGLRTATLCWETSSKRKLFVSSTARSCSWMKMLLIFGNTLFQNKTQVQVKNCGTLKDNLYCFKLCPSCIGSSQMLCFFVSILFTKLIEYMTFQ